MMRAPSSATREFGNMQEIDLERVRPNATAVFPSSEAVVEHPRLSRDQKITGSLCRRKDQAREGDQDHGNCRPPWSSRRRLHRKCFAA